jgi:hypothetical protein
VSWLIGSVLKLKKKNFFYSLSISQIGEISVAANLSYWLMTGTLREFYTDTIPPNVILYLCILTCVLHVSSKIDKFKHIRNFCCSESNFLTIFGLLVQGGLFFEEKYPVYVCDFFHCIKNR